MSAPGKKPAGDAASATAAEDIVDLYQRTADAFDTARDRSLFERAWLDRFMARLPARGSVLDLGCGMGEPLARHLIETGLRVTGVDAAPRMIALCRQRFPDHTWIVGDMRTLALEPRFDGILAWDSFFHLTPDDQERAIAVFGAHAAPGAALMFTSGPRHGVAMGTWENEPLYHASLDPQHYRRLLHQQSFDAVSFVPQDPRCGGHSVWLAVQRADAAATISLPARSSRRMGSHGDGGARH